MRWASLEHKVPICVFHIHQKICDKGTENGMTNKYMQINIQVEKKEIWATVFHQ